MQKLQYILAHENIKELPLKVAYGSLDFFFSALPRLSKMTQNCKSILSIGQ